MMRKSQPNHKPIRSSYSVSFGEFEVFGNYRNLQNAQTLRQLLPPPSMEDKLQVGWRFFKVMMPGFQTKLNLPPLVCKKLQGDKSLQATLITAKGKWNVGIGHGDQGKLSFESGWDVFVQNHGLRVAEFAVFEYIGDISFNVSLLDKSGCEKVFSVELEKDSNLEDDEPNIACEAVADIEREDINSSEANNNEHVDLVAVQLEKDEGMITSELNLVLAPLFDILAEIENEELASHINVCEKDKDRGPCEENIPEHDNSKCHMEQESNKEAEGESSQHSSSFAPSNEIGNEESLPSQVKIQEHVNEVSLKLEVEEDEVPSQIKLQNPEKGRRSVKRRREDEREPSPMKIQKNDTSSSMKLKGDDDRASSQEKIQKHNKKKSSVKHGKNKNRVKQNKHKGITKNKTGDAKRKREPKVNKSSPEENLQFSTIVKQYHIRRRSPYMLLPSEFCVANGLYQNARITLRGPIHDQEVSLKVCKGGKTIYAILTRGWPEFIAGNNLREKDSCIFKLHNRGSSSDAAVGLDVEVLRAAT